MVLTVGVPCTREVPLKCDSVPRLAFCCCDTYAADDLQLSCYLRQSLALKCYTHIMWMYIIGYVMAQNLSFEGLVFLLLNGNILRCHRLSDGKDEAHASQTLAFSARHNDAFLGYAI